MQILYTVSDDFCATWQMNRKPGNAVYAFCGGKDGEERRRTPETEEKPRRFDWVPAAKLCKTHKRKKTNFQNIDKVRQNAQKQKAKFGRTAT